MKVDLLQLMTDLYTALGVQVLLLSSLSELGGQADYDFRRRIFKDFRYDNYIRSFCGDLEAGVLYHIEDDLRLFYSIFYVPAFSKTKYAGSYLFLGPVMFQSLTPDIFNQITAEKKIPPSMFNNVTEFYTKVPLFHSFDMWNTFAVILCSYLIDKNIKVRILRYKGLQPKSIISDYIFVERSESSQNIIQARYEAETRLLNAVSSGNVKEALKAYNCVLQYRIPPRTADLFRNSKNMCIILNTLLRKSAQKACVHTWHIDHLSTLLAIQIERAAEKYDLDFMPSLMIQKYCLLVQKYSRRQYSPVIRYCLDYIIFHYAEELTLRILADKCSVTKCYLSALFHREVTMTVTEYIIRIRLENALHLLGTSALSISEIAFECGFTDPNYFSRMFKRSYKTTPTEYREQVRNTGQFFWETPIAPIFYI